MSAPMAAMTACRQFAMRMPSKNRSPDIALAAKSADPSAPNVAVMKRTWESLNAPRLAVVSPMDDLIGQSTQKVKMNGAARNGIGSHLAMAMVTAPTMHARMKTAIHNAVLTT